MRVELSDGAWVEVRDPESVTNKDRREYKNRVIPDVVDQIAREKGCDPRAVGEVLTGSRVAEILVDRMITAWSFDLPIPSIDPGVWDNDALPFEVYDAVLSAVNPVIASLQGVPFDPQKQSTGSGPDRATPTETSAV